MIPYEIAEAILQYSDLATCVHFSESCKTFQNVVASLDDSLIRDRVLESVPWMELDDSNPSWLQCAQTIRARNAKCRHWKPAGDFRWLEKELRSEEKFVEPENVGGALPDSFEPIFDDLVPAPWHTMTQHFQGNELVAQNPGGRQFLWSTLNVKTLDAEVHVRARNGDGRNAVYDEPIGRRFGVNPGFVVVHETDTVLHFRGQLRDYVAFKGSFDEADFLSRNEYNEPLDDLGVFALPFFQHGIAYVHLFPNSRSKILVGMHYRTCAIDIEPSENEEYTWLYIVDVDSKTNSDNQVQFLTVLPSRPVNWMEWMGVLRDGGVRQQFPANLDFEVTTYNGLLHVFWKGHLVPIWVDLAFPSEHVPSSDKGKELDTNQFIKCSKRVDVRLNLAKPVISGIEGYLPIPEDLTKLIRGKKGLSTSRYVTLKGTCGRLIGDLKTGETYIAKDRGTGRRWRNFLFPGISKQGNVVYYRWAKDPAKKICELLSDTLNERPGPIDLGAQIKEVFDAHPVSGWKFPECSDYDYILSIYGSVWWWPIAEQGWNVDPRALDAMSDKVDSVVREFVDHEVQGDEE